MRVAAQLRLLALLAVLVLLLLGACAAPLRRVPAAAPAAALPAAVPAGSVTLHRDAEIFTAVHRLLAAARERVLVEMYEFGRGDVAAELEAAHARGVAVRVVFDPSVPETIRMAPRLAAAGLAIRPYPLDDRHHQIDHVKLLVADAAALAGGMNWGAASARNHDYALETRAPADLEALRAIFEQDWSLAGGRPALLAPAAGRVLQTGPNTDIRSALAAMLAAARSEVQAEIFLLTDPDVEAALVAARRRGARVRVLLDARQDGNPAALATLRAGGVEARLYPLPGGAKLHAKVLRADAGLLVGSANWTHGGLDVNHELDLRVAEPAVLRGFAGVFEADWARAG